MTDERRLAHPRAALHVRHDGAPLAHPVIRILELRELALPADERARSRIGGGRNGCRSRRGPSEPLEDLRAGRSSGRSPLEQVPTQRHEIRRESGDQLVGGGRVPATLRLQNVEGRALERQTTGQRRIQNDADAVPVRRFGGVGATHQLRRHVGGRAGEMHTVGPLTRLDGAGQSKVQDHDATVSVDQHVGRLDVAVQHALAVEIDDPVGQLAHDVPRPVQTHRGRRRPGRGLDGRSGVEGGRSG